MNPKKIFIDDASMLIEEEDIFERNLSNGAVGCFQTALFLTTPERWCLEFITSHLIRLERGGSGNPSTS